MCNFFLVSHPSGGGGGVPLSDGPFFVQNRIFRLVRLTKCGVR